MITMYLSMIWARLGNSCDVYISIWSCYGVASFTGATTTEAINDAGATVVEAAAGQADAANAGDEDEQHEEGSYQPDPPDDSTFPIYVYNIIMW